MSTKQHHGGWVIIVSFIVGFILTILPLPSVIIAWWPDWMAMMLIYWCIALPRRIGVFTGWLLGILQDILNDTLFGQHALSLCLIAYVSVHFHRQIRIFPWWQQAITVFLLVFASHLPNLWIRGMLGYPVGLSFFYSSLSSMVLWPWVFVILRDLRRTYRVS